MSANLLMHPGKMHTLTDDLESFLHVLGWTTLRFVPSIQAYTGVRRAHDMEPFDEHYKPHESSDEGGDRKSQLLYSGRYPSSTFRPEHPTPLFNLLKELSKPFKSLYEENPPTAEERKMVDVTPDRVDDDLIFLRRTISNYDEDIKRLDSSTWFIATMKMVSDGEGWPKADKVNLKLPVHYGGTKVQDQNKAEQRQRTQDLWEDSKGLRSSRKRAASPTPGCSAKRQRGTPAASGTGI